MASGDDRSWRTEFRQVGPGAFAYVQELGEFGGPATSAGISNAGLILGPDGALVVDTLNVPSHTRAFLKAIGAATSLPLRHVVLTHVHGDHTHGMQFFPDSELIAHERCREQLIEGGQEAIERYALSRPHWTAEFAETRLVLPDVTMTNRMVLYYGERRIELIYKGPAHTDNDVMVYLPQDRLLFAGDIAFYKVGPLGAAGDFENWVRVIDDVLEMPVDTIVPGHGPVGTKDDLREAQAFLRVLVDEGRRCHQAGYGIEEAAARIQLGRFAAWPDAAERLPANLGAMYRKWNADASA